MATLPQVANESQSTPAPDWKSRASNHRTNIYRLLVERGARGVTNNELDANREFFGRAFRNRISELAQMGCKFLDSERTNGKHLGHWEGEDYRYVMVPPYPEKFRPLPDYYAQKEIPWKDRQPVTGLELWDMTAVRR
jgi:hypothetical protein